MFNLILIFMFATQSGINFQYIKIAKVRNNNKLYYF